MRRRAATDQRGFTLIEVLVAVAIAGLLLAVVLRTMTAGLGESERAGDETKAALLAESTLDALGVVTPLSDGGQAEFREGLFLVRATTERYQDSPAGGAGQYATLYRLSVTVSWRDGRRQRAVSLATLRLGPSG